MEGEIDPDFDPTTEEGQEDINDIVDDEYEALLKRPDEDERNWLQRMTDRFARGANYAIRRLKDKFRSKNPSKSPPEYLKLENIEMDDLDPYKEAKDAFLKEHSNFILEDVKFTKNSNNKTMVQFKDKRTKNKIKWTKAEILFNEDGSIRERVKTSAGYKSAANTIPEREQLTKQAKLIVALGEEIDKKDRANKQQAAEKAQLKEQLEEQEEISGMTIAAAREVIENEAALAQDREDSERIVREGTQRINSQTAELQVQEQIASDTNRPPEERAEAAEQAEAIADDISQTQENVEVEERRLGGTKEKIKQFLLKYGLPAAVAVAFAGAIAGLYEALKGGTKEIGHGLAELGKKMAASIPGLLGTVLSFVLRTGGELLKFVGNNIWILVVAIGAVLLKKLKL